MLTVRRLTLLGAAVAAGTTSLLAAQAARSADPFEFFRPAVSVSPQDRLRLDRGETVVRPLAAAGGHVAIVSAAATSVDGDRLHRWVHRIDAMKRGRHAPAVVRFSDPPRLSDLATLELDPEDLAALRDCRPGSCGLKLTAADMATLVPLAQRRHTGWETDVQQAFRAVMLARAERYLAGGLDELPPYHDADRPVRPDDEFRALLQQTPFLRERLPAVADFLVGFPHSRPPEVESFLYWSKEVVGRKPVVSITHVTLTRPTVGPEAVVVSRQVYATHYMSGALAITAIAGGRDGGRRYLVYLNRSRVDVLDGFFGKLVRGIVERRLRDEAGQVVADLRRRLEAGDPR